MPFGVDARHGPGLESLLETLGLDVAYERGRGNFLYYRDRDGREVEVLDLVGGFGSLLLGHSHPVLVAEARRLLARGVPHHAQGSLRGASRRLAQTLSRRAGGDFTNNSSVVPSPSTWIGSRPAPHCCVRIGVRATKPVASAAQALPIVGCPANGISRVGVKMRSR